MIRAGTLLCGLVFGFLLSRGRATDYDAIAGMFRLKDPHLPLLMMTAIATAALGLWLLRRYQVKSLAGTPVKLDAKPLHRGTVVGGLIFGIGWGITGQCPGTALGQLGEGKTLALVTVAGMLAGTWLYGLCEQPLGFLQRRPSAPSSSSSS